MNSDSIGMVYFILSIVGLLIWAAILHSIIAGASRSRKIELQLKLQTSLLAKIAEKQGVSETEIQDIIKPKPVKKSIW